MLAESTGVCSLTNDFADAEEGLDGGVSNNFEVGVVACAKDGDPGNRRASLGGCGNKISMHGGDVRFNGVKFRVEARCGVGKLGLTARETFDAGIDWT